MGLCGQAADCNCAIQGNGINVAGSGRFGDPYIITPLGTYVCTSGTRPTGIQGLQIYETNTLRQLIYDGTNWVIIGGAWPGFSAWSNSTQGVAHNVSTSLTLTESFDPDNILSGSTATIPAGMGGDWDIHLAAQFFNTATGGIRAVQITVASNGSQPNEPTLRASRTPTSVSGIGVTTQFSDNIRLEAGATVSAVLFQNSGVLDNTNERRFRMVMTRHIPSLT